MNDHPDFLRARERGTKRFYVVAGLVFSVWFIVALASKNLLPIYIPETMQLLIFLIAFTSLMLSYIPAVLRVNKFRRQWQQAHPLESHRAKDSPKDTLSS